MDRNEAGEQRGLGHEEPRRGDQHDVPRTGRRGINIQAISTSEIKVSLLIDENQAELSVRALHTAHGMKAQ